MTTKDTSPELQKLPRFALLLIDKLDRVQVVQVFYNKSAMITNYRSRKNAGESHLIKSKINVEITKVYK